MIMTRRKLFSIAMFAPLLGMFGKKIYHHVVPVYHPAFVGIDYAKDGCSILVCTEADGSIRYRSVWSSGQPSFQNIPKNW